MTKLVEGEQTIETSVGNRRHIAEAGGLGVFGWHHARGVIGDLAADAVNYQGEDYIGRAGEQYSAIEGHRCAADDPRNNGVDRQVLLNPGCIGFDDAQGRDPNYWTAACTFIKANSIGFLDMRVIFRDRWQNPVMRVTYRWRFRSEGVKVWIAVEPLATPIANWNDPYTPEPDQGLTGTPFIKEPKLVAGFIRGRDFTRMAVFDQDREGLLANNFCCGHMRGSDTTTNVVHARLSGGPARTRVRWDYPIGEGWPNDIEQGGLRNKQRRGNCPLSADPPTTRACFSMLARAYDAAKVLLPDTAVGRLNFETKRWESGNAPGGAPDGKGLDQWPFDEATQPRAFPVDTQNAQTGNPECTRMDPRTERDWEFAGRKLQDALPPNPQLLHHLNNPRPFILSGAMFHAWRGGRGYTDCEPLLRRFVLKKYGALLTFGLNNTYPRRLKAQVKDSP